MVTYVFIFFKFDQISQDFRKLYPEADRKLFEDWPAMADRIVVYAQRDGKINLELDDLTPGKLFQLLQC